MTTRKPVARKTPKKTPAPRSAKPRPVAKAPAKTAAARKAAAKPVAKPQATAPEGPMVPPHPRPPPLEIYLTSSTMYFTLARISPKPR